MAGGSCRALSPLLLSRLLEQPWGLSVCAEISPSSVWPWSRGASKEESEGGRRRDGGEGLPSLPW